MKLVKSLSSQYLSYFLLSTLFHCDIAQILMESKAETRSNCDSDSGSDINVEPDSVSPALDSASSTGDPSTDNGCTKSQISYYLEMYRSLRFFDSVKGFYTISIQHAGKT
ncbi:hypothetical protein M422DRAFT_54289 [Sphaerobolus stellatus SS14]|uniref:Uncharacterized protein n=1 Tax=Sphaerobolus stellatus (strain SS14) TaxID=990650 RepID=A0A0C9UK28_SPHS4|nr:hypothetical protein M422DRAFT_57159 [Sphaerobolus stellatus SS14]KIJ29242.1 hypothetical protein M422DRAFT_54289 [Sphaerobolus stellatus SS14]